jgi:catechol 2,3-dioxygenase-like lactoylglutathione lyase family enzyme
LSLLKSASAKFYKELVVQPYPNGLHPFFKRRSSLEIIAIEHVAINCVDIQKSIDFYSQILGFEHRQVVDCGDFDIHYFTLPNGARLELFDYRNQNAHVQRSESDSGLRHLAFSVNDVAAHEAALRAAGVEITLSTCDLPALGARVLLFLDPNGVTLEFCEKLA